jgi:hypothetical protein
MEMDVVLQSDMAAAHSDAAQLTRPAVQIQILALIQALSAVRETILALVGGTAALKERAIRMVGSAVLQGTTAQQEMSVCFWTVSRNVALSKFFLLAE